MNILLINPPRVNGLPVIREDRCEIIERDTVLPPYSLLQLASILRNRGHNVNLIDANGDNLSYKELCDKANLTEAIDIIIFRFTPTTYQEDISSIGMLSKKAVVISLCWSLIPFSEKILSDIDIIDIYIIGDYITTVPNLVDCISSGNDLKNITGIVYRENDDIIKNEIKDLENFDYNDLPLPAYDLLSTLSNYYLNIRSESPYTIIYSSKGCPFKCIYCTMAGTRWMPRSADNILNEILFLIDSYGLKSFSFFDETFTYDRSRVVDICNGIINNNIKLSWYCNTRSNKVDLDLLELMSRAGCKGISLGIESGNQSILNNARKGTTVEQNRQAILNAKKAGIKTFSSFIFGLPGESWQTVNETISFVKDVLPNGAQFNVIVPYPNTELFDLAIKNKWITDIPKWNDLHQHISLMRTEFMSTSELEMARKMAYRELYLNPRWIIQNVLWVLRRPNEFPVAFRYYSRSLKNLFLHEMENSH
jgi:anaerobic magnesium-protoporphyrin IX monomethyl ester cyclase